MYDDRLPVRQLLGGNSRESEFFEVMLRSFSCSAAGLWFRHRSNTSYGVRVSACCLVSTQATLAAVEIVGDSRGNRFVRSSVGGETHARWYDLRHISVFAKERS